MKDGQTGDLTYHGTGTLSTMDLTGILWEVLMPELYDLINTYKPDYLYADGPHGPDTYWGSQHLLQMGEWLSVNGETIYGTKPWRAHNDTVNNHVHSKNGSVYAIALEWPSTDELTLGAPISTENTQVTMLGYEGKFVWKPATDRGGIIVCIPVSELPSKWACVVKMRKVK
ncbi:Tissue alpha-L-fucosidase [Desmophyllum pertusum]|uniref:Tissue alpha-L-fucosidase n=1 Tax=Desmophyllum pertusum TaxID=174260 RepID=A0A9X0A2R7_9CNID|nr:Tissue alpha-L-fucosidase [Desmophyllum pertusum]